MSTVVRARTKKKSDHILTCSIDAELQNGVGTWFRNIRRSKAVRGKQLKLDRGELGITLNDSKTKTALIGSSNPVKDGGNINGT